MKNLSSFLILLVLTLISSCTAQQKISTITPTEMTTYILVRHAEKVKGVKDPDLTKEGLERAKALEYLLKDVDLAAIYSSDYKRTQQTALPTAEAKKITITSYDPRDLEKLVEEVDKTYSGKTVLIVGHSNTTPALAKLLTGTDYTSFDESVYDNFFIVNVVKKGNAKAFLLKF
mgnify:CR=1 FL=1